MSRRKRVSGGQAIVMVTLALFSMIGMMGLAVDLGWSYFSQKQAQAAADTAALSAAQEAVKRLGIGSNISGFTCGSTGTGASQVECTETAGTTTLEYCGSSVTSTSNLNNGCLYAKRNGFQYDVAGSRQIVSVQSGDVSDANVPPGLKRISYWVRVRTIQTIPQLFSFIAGNQQGTVAANGTAAIAGSIVPGSFYGMNHAGDCWSLPGAAPSHCGMDLDAESTGQGKTACPGSGGGSGQACAPAGIILSSSCNASSPGGSTCSQTWAGNATRGAGVETGSLVVMGTNSTNGGATPGDWHDSSGNPIAPTYTTAAASFKDPTQGNSQPPLQTSNPIPTCGLQGGNLSSANPVGPYQFYAYNKTGGNGLPIPTGDNISIGGKVTFSSTGTCPGIAGGGTAQGSFATYIFYGGLSVGGTMNLTAGQYVMAGVSSNAANSTVFSAGGTVQAGDTSATSTGTMFVFTDGSYPGLGGPQSQGNTGSGTGQITNLPNWTSMPALYQGNLNFKNPDITMTGLVNTSMGGSNLPSSMNAYTGVVWWQDRRNSMVEYNQDPSLAPNCSNCTKDDGTVVGCADRSSDGCTQSQTTGEIVTDNHVTSSSPGQVLDPGNGTLNLTGVYYQPRGAWLQLVHGTGLGTGGLQTITGSLDLSTGDDRFLLVGPTDPLISYKAVLVQ